MKDYNCLGVMLDVSRNGAMNIETLKLFIDNLEKMGYNTLELYSEDMFKLDSEPYFGYLRGGYNSEEIKEIDDYAKARGIELVPCIQTLSHFRCTSKLYHYKKIFDVNDILLVDDERTYELIEKIFVFCSENFTSKKINIGMDEAHLVGLGKYLDNHSFTDRYEILFKHLNKVCDMAKKYGFKPHMWSDMFFRLANHGTYWKDNIHIDKKVIDRIPKDIELCYWDYYDKEHIDSMMSAHKEFNNEIWFAGGAWTWLGFAPLNHYGIASLKTQIKSVIKYDIKNLLVTLWGDDGKECSIFAVLPTLYSAMQFAKCNFDQASIERGFYETFGFDFNDFMLVDLPNKLNKPTNDRINNPSKAFLYQDCFMGYFDLNAEEQGKIDYKQIADKLYSVENKVGEFGYIFNTLAKLCEFLEYKAFLGVETRKVYSDKKTEDLKQVIKKYKLAEEKLEIFYETFRNLWFKENKGCGFEVHDTRLGGLKQRIISCRRRLEQLLKGEIDKIEELDEPLLKDYPYGIQGFYKDLMSRSYY